MRIAVIGSGISGLAAAYYLSRKHTVWLFEKDSRLGGHTHTVQVDTSHGPLAIDTGFIVHNDRTYPNLIRLFDEIGVETQPSDMSFAVCDRASGYEYSSRGLRGFFARPSSWFSAGQYRLLLEILRFNREAARLLLGPSPMTASLTLGDLLEMGGYSALFADRYLYPMASAVWSMSNDAIRDFPAATLLHFFQNHGMLGINTHPKWKTVKGGSNRYLEPLSKPFAGRIQTNAEIAGVTRTADAVTVRFADPERPAMNFDQVVFACHGNQVLPMLDAPCDREREILGQFETSRNDVVLHTDANLLARREQARASWNYNLKWNGACGATVTYHMNRLQSLASGGDEYCVTLNGTDRIRPEKILRRFVYHHPIYNRSAIAAQQRWGEISGANRTHYCGAYWFYGFHEDGLNSALRVAKNLGVNA